MLPVFELSFKEPEMFGFLKRKPPSQSRPPGNIRDTLFGDMPLEAWPSQAAASAEQEPWCFFVHAREAIATGRVADAIAIWRLITEMVGLESRHYLQAWHFLRAHGVQPPVGKAKLMLGVVLEVPMHGGLDLLAAYPEYTARYYNYSGAGIVWEHPDESLNGLINTLLRSGEKILQAVGPWEQQRPPAPPSGHIRINLLAPAGLHFGQGLFQALAADAMAKPVVDAATALMQQLVARGGQSKS
jgi:hypothetical protein